jgi:hypothetical protein
MDGLTPRQVNVGPTTLAEVAQLLINCRLHVFEFTQSRSRCSASRMVGLGRNSGDTI